MPCIFDFSTKIYIIRCRSKDLKIARHARPLRHIKACGHFRDFAEKVVSLHSENRKPQIYEKRKFRDQTVRANGAGPDVLTRYHTRSGMEEAEGMDRLSSNAGRRTSRAGLSPRQTAALYTRTGGSHHRGIGRTVKQYALLMFHGQDKTPPQVSAKKS